MKIQTSGGIDRYGCPMSSTGGEGVHYADYVHWVYYDHSEILIYVFVLKSASRKLVECIESCNLLTLSVCDDCINYRYLYFGICTS